VSDIRPEQVQTDGPGPDVYDIDFPWTRPPLTANQRLHHLRRAEITRNTRRATSWLARHIPNLGRCEVTLTWTVTDHRRRDSDNLVPTLKAICDGLVDAGITTDDTPDLMVKHMPIIIHGDTAAIRLRITRLGALAA
jgi:Holliday junction resolvase RusA-like endonuclease